MNKLSEITNKLKKVSINTNEYKNANQITYDEWLNTETCICDGNILKYHDSSNDCYVLKCGITKDDFDMKKKEYVKNKYQPCNYFAVHLKNTNNQKKESEENTNNPKKNIEVIKNPNKDLEENIKRLFNVYFSTKRLGILREINITVRNKLHRKAQYEEKVEDFYKRIFSREIIDKSINQVNKVNKINENTITDQFNKVNLHNVQSIINKILEIKKVNNSTILPKTKLHKIIKRITINNTNNQNTQLNDYSNFLTEIENSDYESDDEQSRKESDSGSEASEDILSEISNGIQSDYEESDYDFEKD